MENFIHRQYSDTKSMRILKETICLGWRLGMSKKYKINYPITILYIIIIVLLCHYRYFYTPVITDYTIERLFLYNNGNLGPVSVEVLDSTNKKIMYEYKFKWEKESGYAVHIENYNNYIDLKKRYLDFYLEYKINDELSRDEYTEKINEKILVNTLEYDGFSSEFLECFGDDIEKYNILYSYKLIQKQLHVDDEEFYEYVLFDDNKKSFIHLIRHYKPSDR